MPYANREKQLAYQREWMRRRREEFFAGKCCAKCGSTERLELDHADPLRKVTHRVWSWTRARREAELAKCQVLCHECHWHKTAAELPFLSLYEGKTAPWCNPRDNIRSGLDHWRKSK